MASQILAFLQKYNVIWRALLTVLVIFGLALSITYFTRGSSGSGNDNQEGHREDATA